MPDGPDASAATENVDASGAVLERCPSDVAVSRAIAVGSAAVVAIGSGGGGGGGAMSSVAPRKSAYRWAACKKYPGL